jgi:DNA repair protein RecN (Recombination protein N)
MLQHLTISNFAIVKQLEIHWQKGMTTITGETGAGKSIAIDALGLCLGDRVTTNVVRPGAKKTELTASFEISTNPLALHWLINQELEQEHECILRRVISAEGRSSAFINGCKVPLAQLKEVSQFLINIHGQHDHQLIIKPTEQQRLLDDYANHPELLANVRYQYQQWRKLNAELQELQQSQQQREATRQLLQYQVTELDEFNLQLGEFETLEADYQRQGNGQQLLTDTQHALHQLSDDEQCNVLDLLSNVSDKLNRLSTLDPALCSVTSLIAEAAIQLKEASQDLQHYHDKLELDPQAFALLEERYSMAIQLAKKHQLAPEALAEHHMRLTQQLSAISFDQHRLNSIINDIAEVETQYQQAAELLSDSRKQAAILLNQLISTSMQELNMPHGQFLAEVIQHELTSVNPITARGIDTVEFLIRINPGQPMEAMHKVASGGELSRIGLAMQVVLAEKITSPTLIFDEVDVGISGSTAAMVGKKLRQLGNNAQVICVTHLPQVASKGHQQLFVSKLTDGEQTETKVTELTSQGRVREIARLLAGDSITDHSIANAQELLAS